MKTKALFVALLVLITGCSEEPTVAAGIVKDDKAGCTVKGKPELSDNGERVTVKFESIECPLVEIQ